MMQEGSKWKLWIPSDMGYGDRGAGSGIPGGALLVFDIELLEVLD
jgi:FKBP-type peptidyl-prolyl cis-trans isomerase FklB